MNITNSDRITIRAVIKEQIQAFRHNDAQRAFSFAAPAIQQRFGNAINFLEMVKQGYPQVYRPRSVIFEDLTSFEGQLTQPVLLLGADDQPVRALYMMEKQPENRWRIGGCYIIPISP